MARSTSIRSGDGNVVCENCLLADNPWLRVKGLLGRKELPDDEGILLRPASSIHMAFMRFPIDAVFLAEDLTVLKVVQELKPWRMAAKARANAVLELPAGTCERRRVRVGDRLALA